MATRRSPGLSLLPGFVRSADRAEALAWVGSISPLWEQRWSTVRGPPPGQEARALLRPVYWLGNWQFACLGYYEPPRGTRDRAVAAEGFPPFMVRWVREIEARIRRVVPADAVPPGWALDTCLVNLYGTREVDGRTVDTARVGAHRDREPGPVASVSLGERALFQFVTRGSPPEVVLDQWLDDGALQVFGGRLWKDQLLHRVQRVEDRKGLELAPQVAGFRTRRVNFTFRHVPPEHVVPFAALGDVARADVRGYVTELAEHSPFWRDALARADAASGAVRAESGLGRGP